MLEDDEESFNDETIAPSPMETIAPSDIPIKVQLEVGRFEVSLEELSKLEPGYKLPIDINPKIVYLTAAGKIFGKGEMLEIGDTIGVRILELYGRDQSS